MVAEVETKMVRQEKTKPRDGLQSDGLTHEGYEPSELSIPLLILSSLSSPARNGNAKNKLWLHLWAAKSWHMIPPAILP